MNIISFSESKAKQIEKLEAELDIALAAHEAALDAMDAAIKAAEMAVIESSLASKRLVAILNTLDALEELE